MIVRIPLAAVAVAVLASVVVLGPPDAGAQTIPLPAWCESVTTGASNPTGSGLKRGWFGYTGAEPADVTWPASGATDAEADRCLLQQVGFWPRSSVYPSSNFRVSGALSCQSVVTEGYYNFGDDLSTWDRMAAWLRDNFPLLAGLLEELGADAGDGIARFGVTCWMPDWFQNGDIPRIEMRLRPGDGAYTGSGCVLPPFPFPPPNNNLVLSTAAANTSQCEFLAEDLGDVVRVHWAGTMDWFEIISDSQNAPIPGEVQTHVLLADWANMVAGDERQCVGGDGCRKILLVDAHTDVGVISGDDFALPNPPSVPGWVDQGALGACRLMHFKGDDLTGVTWTGGETVNFEGVYLPGVQRSEQIQAVVEVTLGAIEGDEHTVNVTTKLPGSFSVTVPSDLPSPLVPNVSFRIKAPDCNASSWYDPSGEGGAPGSAADKMSFEECVDSGLDGRIPQGSGITEPVMTAAAWVVCGVYMLFQPEKGYGYYISAAQMAAGGGAFGDLVDVWQTGSRVLSTLRASASSSQGATISVAGQSVTIDSPSGDVVSALRIGIAVLVLIGSFLFGTRLVLRALGVGGGDGDGKGGDDK